jgi:hypothetical protein
MNLPKVVELTPSEAQARVHFASEDDLKVYLPLYQWPFSKIFEFTHLLRKQRISHKKPNSENQESVGVQGVTKLGCSHADGYDNCCIPTRTDGGIKEFRRKIQTQFWYGTLAAAEGDLLKYYPQQQLHRMMDGQLSREKVEGV